MSLHVRPSRGVVVAVWASSLLLGVVAGSDLRAEPAPVAIPGGDVLDTPLEPLHPKNARSENEQDALEALSLFAAARAKEQHEDLDGALRLYQRAFRNDPTSAVVLEQIVALASALERSSEAIRYASISADRAPKDPLLMRQLALHLAEEGEKERAIEMYEKAISLPGLERKTAGYMFMTAELAQLYARGERFDDAAKAFRTVQDELESKQGPLGEERVRAPLIEGLGGEAEAYQAFGDAYLGAKQLDEALAAFKKRNELDPDEARLNFNTARVELARDNADAAREQLKAYFAARSNRAGLAAYELLGKILEKQQRGGEFIAELEALHEADPDNAPLAYFLSERYREAGQNDKIEKVLAGPLEKAPAIEVYQALVRLFSETKQPEKLLEVLGACAAEAESLDPLADEVEELAKNAELVDGILGAARDKQAADLGSLPFGQRLSVAQVALAAGRIEPAKEFFELALSEKQDNVHDLLVAWGSDLLAHEQPAEAAAVLKRAIEELPAGTAKPPVALYYLAGALEMSGQTDEAMEIAREAARRGEKLPRLAPLLYSRIGWVAYHAKRFAAAESSYRQLLALYGHDFASDDTRDVLRDTRLALSNLAVIRDNLPEAEEWLEEVLDEFPEDVSAQNDLGYLWADQGKHLGRALKMLQNAVAAQPDNLAYRDSLGWALHRLGRNGEALVELEKAVGGSEEPDGVILDHLGDVYLVTGNLPKARDCWERAITVYDPAIDRDQIEATKRKLAEHPAAGDAGEAQAAKPAETPKSE